MLARLATSTGKKAEDSEAALEKYLHTVLAVENTLTLDRLRQVWRYSHIRTLALIRLDVSRQVMHCVQTGEVSGLIGISVGNYFCVAPVKGKKPILCHFTVLEQRGAKWLVAIAVAVGMIFIHLHFYK